MVKERLMKLAQETTILRSEGKYIKTIQASDFLLELASKTQDHKAMMTAHINLAASYFCIGDMEEALKSIEAHHELCLRDGNDAAWLNAHNIRFLLHSYNKEHDLAIETLKKSILLGKKLNHYNIVSNAYSNYSHILQELEQHEEGLKLAELSLDFAKLHEPFSPILLFRSTLNIANAIIYLGETDKAKQLLDDLWASDFLTDFPREKAQLYVLQARWHEVQLEFKKAFDAYSTALKIVGTYKDLTFSKDIQQQRIKLLDVLGDFEKGYQIQKEYIELLHALDEQALAQKTLQLNLKLNQSSIVNQINIDPLTGLYNRSYIEETTDKWLLSAQEKDDSVICITFDIDNLKVVNDNYGHLMGDEMIKKVAEACAKIVRKEDLLGRFGGDEFLLIMKGISIENGKIKAQQIVDTIKGIQLDTGTKFISVTVSIGVSDNVQQQIISFKELFHLADLALYKAKENGKDQVVVYS